MVFATKWYGYDLFSDLLYLFNQKKNSTGLLIIQILGHKSGSREARLLTGIPGGSQGGQISYRGPVFHKEAGLLTGRPGLS